MDGHRHDLFPDYNQGVRRRAGTDPGGAGLTDPPPPPVAPRAFSTTPATCDPKEDDSVVLQAPYVEVPHLLVAHGAVGQLLVDLPGRVRHDHAELAYAV